MAKNKVRITTDKKAVRLQKAIQWLAAYEGARKRLAVNYRKKFHVDILVAIQDLQALGVEFTDTYLEAVKKGEEARIRQIHLRKEKKRKEMAEDLTDSDDNFAFIAGYTSGGAPYGLTWEEYEEGDV